MSYTKAELNLKIQESITEMNSFYRQEFVNYRGTTSDTRELYTEVIAKYLCENINLFESINVIKREDSYKMESHDGKYAFNSNRIEEKIAMDIFCMSKNENVIFDEIGTVIDYQIPLKNVSSDVAGKIDLLSLNKDTARVLELKTPKSKETMLRCVLESVTYLRTLHIEKCKKDFGIDNSVEFKASPFVFLESAQHKEFLDKERGCLHKLMEMLDVQPFFINEEGDRVYKVVK